ncbi:ABC transporter ATP-binding protein [Oceaniglobus indicus]|uniref:ABC transporter ATP-binding protein n=1 Tax=Oceaniglobus indicus TaxID=2047749 RepID=UPI000C1A7328|nr:ABC transporter ATP-binding protein [Oceaniglobus indicus]
MTLLRMEGIAASYGAARALFDVRLDLDTGQVVALMGRNGMGKTTTIRALFGLIPITGGQILFDGRNLRGMPAHARAQAGLGLVPEGRRCFAPLTVRENLIAAARPGPWDMARVTGLFPRLGERSGQRAASLSGGEQQMLAIGRALMTNPRILVLDEATEGLAPLVRQEIWDAITTLKAAGLSILVVDKSLADLHRVADAGVILERGATVWAGAMEALPPDVATRYLGV